MEKLRIGNRQLIKDLNRAKVLVEVKDHGPISRTDVSKSTKLGLSTITNIVDSLIENELVFEVGSADSTGGRRPVLLDFNYQFGYTVGIKIEENRLNLAVTDLKGIIIHKLMKKHKNGDDPEQTLILMVQSIKELMISAELPQDKVLGIGVAVSGLVNSQEGIVIRSSFLGWENVNIKEKIESEFHVPVYIDNDVNAYTLAELWMGYGKTYENFICITVGAGIGAGIVIDRELYYGSLGGAGEFGHTIIQFNGRQCFCGQRGCLEMYASEKYLKKEGQLLLGQFSDSILKESEFTFEDVHEAACQRDPLALELFRQSGEHLGIGLINMINSLNPSTIIFAGEGLIAKEFFLPFAKDTSDQNFFAKAGHETEFCVSKLGDDAWLSGAALLAIKQLFKVPLYEQSHSII
jgi:N-acetylglucosamine repressor